MLGEQYFKHRFIDVYEYSIMDYKSGRGKLSLGGKTFQVGWEVLIPVSGEIIMVISSDDVFSLFFFAINNDSGELTGTTEDGEWIINAKEIMITSVSSKLDTSSTTLTCSVNYFNCKKVNNDFKKNHLVGYMSNFDFTGVQISERDGKYVKDSLSVRLHDRECVFRQLEHRKDILERIKSKRIDRAILSTLTFSILNTEKNEDTNQFIEYISWFLSLVNVKATLVPIITYYNDQNELIELEYRNLISSPYHSNVIIDNHRCLGGLVKYFDECYGNFVSLYNELGLNVFINSILGMYEGKFLEHKIAGLILSYEFLLTKYLVKAGDDYDRIKVWSIQDKLRSLNRYMRFIPARLLADTFRQDVRNALFHTGEISTLSYDEKIDIFFEYYDLLIQIILRILNYRGKYITPRDYSVSPLY